MKKRLKRRLLKIYMVLKGILSFKFFGFLNEYRTFKKKANDRFSLSCRDFYPCLHDRTTKTGFDAHYVYQTSWAARKVKEINPEKHVDISSSLYFSGIVSAFVPVDFYDYRPADLKLSNLKSSPGDLNKLDFVDNSIISLSCLHTIEHVGLGRYGDEIDPAGDLKAIAELKRVVAQGGSLLFVVPVGRPRIEYNAHRIYSFEMVREYFKDWELKEFSLVDDNGRFITSADPEIVSSQEYACGCFWFKKI